MITVRDVVAGAHSTPGYVEFWLGAGCLSSTKNFVFMVTCSWYLVMNYGKEMQEDSVVVSRTGEGRAGNWNFFLVSFWLVRLG